MSIVRSILVFALLSTVACSGARPVPPAPATPAPRIASAPRGLHPSMGATLASARTHDFFTFFAWTDRGRENHADGTTAVLFGTSPQAADYLAKTRLIVTVDGDDRVVSMELHLARELLDGPYGMLGLDVLKSFVRASAREPIDPDVSLLADVRFGGREQPNDVIASMLLVVGGKSDSATLERNGVQLRFVNTGGELVATATPI